MSKPSLVKGKSWQKAKKLDDFQCYTALLWGAGSSRYLQNLTVIYTYPKEALNDCILCMVSPQLLGQRGERCLEHGSSSLSLEPHKTLWPSWPPCSTARSPILHFGHQPLMRTPGKMFPEINRAQCNICTISLMNYTGLEKSQLNDSGLSITFHKTVLTALNWPMHSWFFLQTSTVINPDTFASPIDNHGLKLHVHPSSLPDGDRTAPLIFLEFSLDHKLMAVEERIKIAWATRTTGVTAGMQDSNSSRLWASWDINGLSSTPYTSLQRG